MRRSIPHPNPPLGKGRGEESCCLRGNSSHHKLKIVNDRLAPPLSKGRLGGVWISALAIKMSSAHQRGSRPIAITPELLYRHRDIGNLDCNRANKSPPRRPDNEPYLPARIRIHKSNNQSDL